MTDSRRPPRSTAPDRAFIWMVMLAGGVLALGGGGVTALSLSDHDGRAALWIVFAAIGLVGVAFGLRALTRRARG
ncbi:hypothetical protein ACFPJ4_03190 [Lysinimonas soli]|uniref:Uncharacterized protein n=1 Tax=Lysinimonas soli TaxID=1074233 RepID=A0ABW0NKW6_9MICO